MIGKVLGLKGKLIIAGVVLTLVAGFAWRYEAAIKNAAKWAVGLDQLERTLKDERAAHAATRAYAEQQEQMAIERQAAIRELRRQRDEQRHAFERQEAGDAELAEWGAQPLPGVLTGGMQSSAARSDQD